MVNPRTNQRWANRYTITVGIVAMAAAAMSRFHSVPYWPWKFLRPTTGMVASKCDSSPSS
jgi:hypothetical protein